MGVVEEGEIEEGGLLFNMLPNIDIERFWSVC